MAMELLGNEFLEEFYPAEASLTTKQKTEKRTPHPGPLPIGSADSADAEREKRALRSDVAMPGIISAEANRARKAHLEGTTLKQAAVGLGYLTEGEFDRLVRPGDMLAPVKRSGSRAGRRSK